MSILLMLIRKMFQLILDTLLKTSIISVLPSWSNYCRGVKTGCLFSSHKTTQALSSSEVFELTVQWLFWDVSVLKSAFYMFHCETGEPLWDFAVIPPRWLCTVSLVESVLWDSNAKTKFYPTSYLLLCMIVHTAARGIICDAANAVVTWIMQDNSRHMSATCVIGVCNCVHGRWGRQPLSSEARFLAMSSLFCW